MNSRSGPRWYPHAEFPREMDICLTNACNLACRYCYFRGKKRLRPDWLGLSQIKRPWTFIALISSRAGYKKSAFPAGSRG